MPDSVVKGPESIKGKVKGVLMDLDLDTKDTSERRISGYASRPVVDRVNEIVDVDAFTNTMSRYAQNPIMLYMHSASSPIGTIDKHELRPDGLWVSGTLVAGVAEADKAWTLITHKVLKAFSIGFREIDGGPEEDGHYHIRRLELLEISVVAIPANQDALFTMGENGKLMDIQLLDPEAEEKAEPVAERIEAEALPEVAEPEQVVVTLDALADAAIVGVLSDQISVLHDQLHGAEKKIAYLESCMAKLVLYETNRLRDNAAAPPKAAQPGPIIH